jgi:hypothetical protein
MPSSLLSGSEGMVGLNGVAVRPSKPFRDIADVGDSNGSLDFVFNPVNSCANHDCT